MLNHCVIHDSSKKDITINLLLAFYGDDFTGSTDVLESLSYGGVNTVLFVQPPTEELLARYSHVRAMGIAGSSRAMTPDEMEVELPPAFTCLNQHGPSIVHYKTCSTFDSSAQIGSIGRAIDIGFRTFGNQYCPLVVGAPSLQRFCVFGNLFARSGLDSVPFRLDRHPSMSRHPVTPMDEADLRVHLGRQTKAPIHLIDVLALDQNQLEWKRHVQDQKGIVLFDTLYEEHLPKIGQAIWEMRQAEEKTLFIAGSSGAEYALVDYWKSSGIIADDFQWTGTGQPQRQTLVVSGSCSPVTARQIDQAVETGFTLFGFDSTIEVNSEGWRAEIERVVKAAVRSLRDGQSVIIHTCRGPDDPRIEKTTATAKQLGETLADILKDVLHRYPLNRVAVTGGDTSGHVARRLKIQALEIVGPMAPGSPLCSARSVDETINGLEITFKGGQVGHDDFFATVLRGHP